MFLTQLTLNTRSFEARRDLGNAYDMHRTLSRAFSPSDDGHPKRFLWRLESSAIGWKPPIVLVQSLTEGDWSVLHNIDNYLATDVEQKHVDPTVLLQPKKTMKFRFLANPTVRRNGKRLGLHSEQDQLNWLSRQGEKHGFSVDFAVVSGTDVFESKKAAHLMTIQRVLFDGVLKVEDVPKEASVLVAGIGPAKAFGCGMLSLANV